MITTQTGFDSDFQRSDDGTSGGVFATVGEIIDFVLPEFSRDTQESTHSKSPEGWREFIGGLKDGGEAGVVINFDPADPTTALFLSDINTDIAGYYKFVFRDATEWEFKAFATNFKPEIPIDDRMTATFNIKLTGKPGPVA